MKFPRTMTKSMLVLSLAASASWGAQKCTPIQIELNGATVATPREVSLLVTRGEAPVVVPVIDGCFRLPERLRHAKSIDVIFQVEGNRVHLREMEPSAFAVGWRVMLRDSATTGPFAAYKYKNVPARELCVVEFETEGDGTAEVQTGCRTVLKNTDGSSAQK